MSKEWTYYLPNQFSYLLNWCSLDAAICANNHTMDYDTSGLLDLMSELNKIQIPYTGIGKNTEEARKGVVLKHKNTKIAILSYSKMLGDWMFCDKNKPGTLPGYFQFLREDIDKMKSIANIIIIYFHWGSEYQKNPKSYQIELAHYAIEKGADVVLGSHSHRLMAIEKYLNKPIVYSLGNFLFGTIQHKDQDCGFIKIFINNQKLQKIELHPFILNNAKAYVQPLSADSIAAQRILKSVKEKSLERGTILDIQGSKAVLYLH